MADQNEIDATIDRLHEGGATDEEVASLIKEKFGKPFDVKKQNAIMQANMAKQPEGTGVESPAVAFAKGAKESTAYQAMPGRFVHGLRAINAHMVEDKTDPRAAAYGADPLSTGVSDVLKSTGTAGALVGGAALLGAPAAIPAALTGAATAAAAHPVIKFGAQGLGANEAQSEALADVGSIPAAIGGAKIGPAAIKFATPRVIRGVAGLGDYVDPDILGMGSPRLKNAVKAAQKVRGVMDKAGAPAAAPPAPPAVALHTAAGPESFADAVRAEALRQKAGAGAPVAPVETPISPVTSPMPQSAVAPAAPPEPSVGLSREELGARMRKSAAPQQPTAATTNASGESSASAESLSRFKDAKDGGSIVVEQKGRPDKHIINDEQFVQTRDNLEPGQTLVRIDPKTGARERVDTRAKAPVGAGNKAPTAQDIGAKAFQDAKDLSEARQLISKEVERVYARRRTATERLQMKKDALEHGLRARREAR